VKSRGENGTAKITFRQGFPSIIGREGVVQVDLHHNPELGGQSQRSDKELRCAKDGERLGRKNEVRKTGKLI